MLSAHKRSRMVLNLLVCLAMTAALLSQGLIPGVGGVQPVQAAACNVSGAITVDTTWNPSVCDPYIATGNIVVVQGVTLTITPGARLLFNAGKAMQISGTLAARGSSASPIRISANGSTTPGFWGYILFADSATDASYSQAGDYLSGSIIQYATVEYGGGLNVSDNGMIRMDSSSPFIDHVTVQKSASDGTHAFDTAHPRILNSIIQNNAGSGIYQSEATSSDSTDLIEIGSNTIENNQNSGIVLRGSGKVNIHDNQISGNSTPGSGGGIDMSGGWRDSGIYSGYYFTVINNTITGNTAGANGGGIALVECCGGVMINNNFVSENSASTGSGGGLFFIPGSEGIGSGNMIYKNTAAANGGGIAAADPYNSKHFDHNIIAGNTAGQTGGGVYGFVQLTYDAVLSNTALTAGGVDYQGGVSEFNHNTILGNQSTGAAAGDQVAQAIALRGHPTLVHNNIVGNNGYALYNHNLEASGDVTAANNWWGTASAGAIQYQIYDWVADGTLSLVNYVPFLTAPDTDAPIAPPTNVQGVRASTSIALTWAANAESDLAGYKVYWGTNGYPYDHVQDVGNATHTTIPGLDQGANYQVAVTAYDQSATGTDDQVNGNESWFTTVELTEISPTVSAITPASGLADTATQVTITGDNFAPTPTAILGGYYLTNVTYQDPQTLKATVPAGMPVGVYDLTVTNPDHQSDTLVNGFEVKTGAPVLVQVLPGQGGADQPNDLHLYGLNFTSGTTATLGTTPPSPLSVHFISNTQLRAAVPIGLTPGIYPLMLQNPHSDVSSYPGAYEVVAASQIDLSATSFGLWTDPVTLREGQPIQIGLIVHREGGSSPLPNVKVRFYNGDPTSGGTLIGDGAIPMMGLSGDFATSAVSWTGVTQGDYTLFAVIDPDNAVNEVNEANNTISRQVTVLAPASDQVPPTVDSFAINNNDQQTSTTAITLDSSISDPAPSSGVASLMYIEYEYSQGAGQWIPVKSTDWLPYDASHTAYPWTLEPVAGMRYMQTWGSDSAGNISQFPKGSYINYMPASEDLVQGQVRVYRFNLNAGQQFTATLTPISGDPDLYVWPATGVPWKSDQPGTAIDTVSFAVPSDGVYQVEVHAYSATTYSLTVGISGGSSGVAAQRLQPDSSKPIPSSPILPASSQPGQQAGLPSAPQYNFSYSFYLPYLSK